EDPDFPSAHMFSSYSWGGMCAPKPHAEYAVHSPDFMVTPAEVRPLNKYLDAAATAKNPVKVTICPGDRSAISPTVGDQPPPITAESDRTSYEAFGNSYSINWFFQEDPARDGQTYLRLLYDHGKHAVKQNKDGARAGEWVIMWENHCD